MNISLTDGEQAFVKGRSFLIAAKNDPNDPVSENLGQALNEYFRSVIFVQVETAKLLNDLWDKVDRIEKKLGR